MFLNSNTFYSLENPAGGKKHYTAQVFNIIIRNPLDQQINILE